MQQLELLAFCFAPFVALILVAVFIDYMANKSDKY
jgi:hypothetical protein